jgi:hypothetical protein
MYPPSSLSAGQKYDVEKYILNITAFRGPVDGPCLRELTSVYASQLSKHSLSIPRRLFLVYLGLRLVYVCRPRVDHVYLPLPLPKDSPLPPALVSWLILGCALTN